MVLLKAILVWEKRWAWRKNDYEFFEYWFFSYKLFIRWRYSKATNGRWNGKLALDDHALVFPKS